MIRTTILRIDIICKVMNLYILVSSMSSLVLLLKFVICLKFHEQKNSGSRFVAHVLHLKILNFNFIFLTLFKTCFLPSTRSIFNPFLALHCPLSNNNLFLYQYFDFIFTYFIVAQFSFDTTTFNICSRLYDIVVHQASLVIFILNYLLVNIHWYITFHLYCHNIVYFNYVQDV